MINYSSYSDVDLFHEFHENHVFKPESTEYIKKLLKKFFGNKKIQLLEIGAGTGHHTKRLSVLSNAVILSTEPDAEYFAKLKEYLKEKKNVKVKKAKAETLKLNKKFDAVLGFDSHHHIPFKNRKKFLNSMKNLLKKNGLYILEDEFIEDYSNEKQRVSALKKLHNFVIMDSLRKKNFALAHLEKIFLQQSIAEQGEYKTSTNKFEKELKENSFELIHKKHIGPKGKNFGVFVYAFKRA